VSNLDSSQNPVDLPHLSHGKDLHHIYAAFCRTCPDVRVLL
jgi:hypothetical protein